MEKIEKVKENIKKIIESKSLFRILCGIGIVIFLMLVFYTGVTVGVHKASFGQAWGEHYNENFGMGYNPNTKWMGMMSARPGLDGGYFPNAHGAVGKIIKIEPPNIIVQDKDNMEKVISIGDDTQIEKARTKIGIADLNVNDFTVTIGTPDNQGIIEAKFIRVIPSPQLLK